RIAVGAVALESRDEPSAVPDAQRELVVIAARVCVHLELAAARASGRVVAAPLDGRIEAVVAVIRPDDDEAAGRVAGDERARLSSDRVRVHLELGPGGGPAAVETLREDAAPVAVVRLFIPRDQNVAGAVAGGPCIGLIQGDVRVHLDLGAD